MSGSIKNCDPANEAFSQPPYRWVCGKMAPAIHNSNCPKDVYPVAEDENAPINFIRLLLTALFILPVWIRRISKSSPRWRISSERWRVSPHLRQKLLCAVIFSSPSGGPCFRNDNGGSCQYLLKISSPAMIKLAEKIGSDTVRVENSHAAESPDESISPVNNGWWPSAAIPVGHGDDPYIFSSASSSNVLLCSPNWQGNHFCTESTRAE